MIPDIGDSIDITVPGTGGQAPFLRGDVDQDGTRNLLDAVAIVRAVFGLGIRYELIRACMDSADTDDDEDVDVADALFMLNYLFLRGPEIAAPAVSCGLDPSGEELTCSEYTCR